MRSIRVLNTYYTPAAVLVVGLKPRPSIRIKSEGAQIRNAESLGSQDFDAEAVSGSSQGSPSFSATPSGQRSQMPVQSSMSVFLTPSERSGKAPEMVGPAGRERPAKRRAVLGRGREMEREGACMTHPTPKRSSIRIIRRIIRRPSIRVLNTYYTPGASRAVFGKPTNYIRKKDNVGRKKDTTYR